MAQDYWSLLNGDGKIVWGPDAELTPLGIQQAKDNHTAWKEQISKKIRLPQAYYSSPFTRSLDTMLYTWKGISLDFDNALRPLVMEDLREDIGVHTCDKRRTRSFIEGRFGSIVDIEPQLTEEDELWSTQHRETHSEHDARSRDFLNYVFDLDWKSETPVDYVSVTSHSGTTNSLLSVIGHRRFQLGTGGMIPVIVRAQKL
ncbi:Pmu1p [Sugiyamaella lignohabitans]|uniref:Pmu1p n=1 Tax=Sugiyamaella lignohabitans TaxID=796027 RepID=A0A161HKS7_9ASCO|nr:Pmu1p [Sugiyamaella lignohabitans]ANB13717.1 Pmu1p [Sugiyamaella lignohabitans]